MYKINLCDMGMQPDPAWNTFVNVLEPGDELPMRACERLYLDFETTSGDPTRTSINPHKHCSILGAAVLFDDDVTPYYVPVRHQYGRNCNVNAVHDWLKFITSNAKMWVNHNIKYDFHVLLNELDFYPTCKLVDTLILCKLADLQEQFSWSLDNAMKVVCGLDITGYEKTIKSFLDGSKDYGVIPLDKMAPYAAVDTLAVRKLFRALPLSPEIDKIRGIEERILPLLINMEQIGVKVDEPALFKEWEEIVHRQVGRIKKIKELSGLARFEPGTKASLKELFVDRLGWDLDFTEKSIEKYTKGILRYDEQIVSYGYASLMRHRAKAPELLDTYIAHSEDEKLLTAFIQPYLEQHTDSTARIHPSYNQAVRTGRMSCSSPNLQQVPASAKRFFLPFSEDHVLVAFDLSQIEFRVIVHYIKNERCIEAYRSDPATDFHTWVAQMCGIERTPAKNINFMLGYGGGKAKCVAMLSELGSVAGDDPELSQMMALIVYNNYHAALPELKRTQYAATDTAKARGFVRTLYGRRRFIRPEWCFKAFNSVCQGSAADIMKEITVRLKPYLGPECMLHLLVHDSWIFSIKKSRAAELVPLIKATIEADVHGLSVPILSSSGVSEVNWKECKV